MLYTPAYASALSSVKTAAGQIARRRWPERRNSMAWIRTWYAECARRWAHRTRDSTTLATTPAERHSIAGLSQTIAPLRTLEWVSPQFTPMLMTLRALTDLQIHEMVPDMPLELRTAQTPADFEAIFPVMHELRPHLSFQDYTQLIEFAAKRDEYQLVGAFQSERCVGAMGMRILFDFVHGKHLYIDDLVTTLAVRSQGIGAKLLAHANAYAKAQNCKLLRLSTGIDNEGGKKFYEREGWKMRSVTYKKPV